MRRGSQRRVLCGLNTHGCKPVLRNALGLSLEHRSGGVAMPLSKRSQDAPLLSSGRMGCVNHIRTLLLGLQMHGRSGAGEPSTSS